ncbi:T-cell surface glycoprotein CD4-like isoform X2 [Arapaima gigas]
MVRNVGLVLQRLKRTAGQRETGPRCREKEDGMTPSGGLIVLLTIVTSTTCTQNIVEVIGQVGHSTILPNAAKKKDVTWRFGTTEQNIDQLLLLTLKGMNTVGESMKGRVSFASGNRSLVITKLEKKDFGFYTCEGKDNTPTIKYRLYEATVRPSPGTLLVASTSLTLSCDVNPLPKDSTMTFEWYSPQKEKMEKTSKTLKVPFVTWRHNGVWTCVVVLKNTRAEITVSVAVGDIVAPASETIYTSVSSMFFTLPCTTTLELSWFSQLKLQGGHWSFRPFLGKGDAQKIVSLSVGSPVKWETQQDSGLKNWTIGQGELKQQLSIQKNKVREEDAGFYTCELYFSDGVRLNRTVRVEVLKVISSHGSTVQEGQDLNLTCTLGHNLAAGLYVEWVPPGKSSRGKLNSSLHKALLSIPNPTMEDKGSWKCKLRNNQAELISAELKLTIVKSPVNVWLLVSVCGAVVAFFLLFFLIVMLIRRNKQRALFRRRRQKTKYCCCKHPQPKAFHRT